MIVEADGIRFDNNTYYAEGDVLYLHVGSPDGAVDWDETPEGVHTRWGPDGELVGLTIVNARLMLERDGVIVVTLPDRRIEITDVGDLLAAA
ncbi:MAG: hypothetical protein HW413_2636 [Thermoleophilia bacterium]|nr:hypothetical protein [Thermoleophilia bacterium]